MKDKTDDSVVKNTTAKKKEYKLDTVFWRDKGGNGIVIPEADCIYMKNAWGEKTYVCTVRDYENGKNALMIYCTKNSDITGYSAEPETDGEALSAESLKQIKGYFSK